MGNAILSTRESISDDALDVGGISDFEHCFSASIEDATANLLPAPLPGYTPAAGLPSSSRRDSKDTIHEPLTGRLVQVHMMETELLLKEAVGVAEQTVLRVPYVSIRVLTWDHAASSLKVDHEEAVKTSAAAEASKKEGRKAAANNEAAGPNSPGRVFVSFRVENSIDLEDELKQRAKAEAFRARNDRREPQASPTSVYLGMFAGFTKPKPFQRKRPNLSFTVPEGKLPTLKDMRRWSNEEHEGISRPQICSLRPKLAMDAVFLGENRFTLSGVDGIAQSSPTESPNAQYGSRYGELVLTFASLKVQLIADCGRDVTYSYEEIDEWSIYVVPGTGPRPPSGLELWISPERGEREDEHLEDDSRIDDTPEKNRALDHKAKVRKEIELEAGVVEVWKEDCNYFRGRGGSAEGGSGSRDGRGRHRVFLSIPDEDLVLARNSMEYFWNMRRAELHLPPKAGSTHGRCVASMITLRGEVKAPALPTGRTDPVDLNGVDIRVGQLIHHSPKRGHLNLMPSPRALLGVEKKRTLRHNDQARSQWERVVVHQGWLQKRGGGAIKRWIWRYFVLYDTPQGHFLGYYNDVSDVPLFNEARKERQLVDLCKVCFLRPEIGRQRRPGSELPPNAFTIVTTERQWTLAAASRAAVLEWLCMISVAVDEDVAVVHDGEIPFEVKAHWTNAGGSYGPENAGTVHLGSMGMELRFGYSEAAAASLAALSAHPKKRASASANYATNVRFWSFTDFYKWTIVSLHDGARGLAVQCFTDDEFETRENMLLITPHARRLALAIEHQVEKFMAVMHLRLENPDTMVLEAGASASSPKNAQTTGTDTTTTAVVAQSSGKDGVQQGGDADSPFETSSGGARKACSASPKSTTEELHRVPSMNLATDPAVWAGDATITPGAPYRRASSGAINPFDSSSDEGENDEEAKQEFVGAWGEATTGGNEGEGESELDNNLDAHGRRPISKGTNNPFDFSFYDDKETTAAAAAAAARGAAGSSRDCGVEKMPSGGVVGGDIITRSQDAVASLSLDSQSSRICEASPVEQDFPAAATATAPSPNGVATAATQEAVWPAAVESSISPSVDQLFLPFGDPPRMQASGLRRAESPSPLIGAPASPLNSTGLLSTTPTNGSPLSFPPLAAPAPAATSGMVKSPRDKRLPPTPLLAFGAEGASSPSPTPPATPFSMPLAKAPTMDWSATLRETTGGAPSSGAAQVPNDLFSAFRDTTEAPTTPPLPNRQEDLFSAFRDTAATPITPPTKVKEEDDLFFAFRDTTEIPPASPSPTKEQQELHLAFRDNITVEPPLPRPAEIPAELHSAFRDGEDATSPQDTPLSLQQPDGQQQQQQKPALPPKPDCKQALALLDGAGSSQRMEDFNPFGRPGSFVLPDAPADELPPPGGTVIHDNGSSVRVVLEGCIKNGKTFSLTLRYELRVPPQTTFSVELVKDERTTSTSTSSALEISFHPNITSTELDLEEVGIQGDQSHRQVRQVLSITCARAFCSPPKIVLTTSDRPLATTRVPLPVVTVTAFFTGLSLEPAEFRQRWTTLPCTEQAIAGGEEVTKQQHQQQGGRLRGTRHHGAVAEADVRRLLVKALGMREVVQSSSAGSVPGVALIAAAGELMLTTPSSSPSEVAVEGGQGGGASQAVVCLVGVELHSAAGAARVTTKSSDRVLAENLQKEVLESIRQIRLGTGVVAPALAEKQQVGDTTTTTTTATTTTTTTAGG